MSDRIAAYLAQFPSYEARYAASFAHWLAETGDATKAEAEAAPHARGIRGTHAAAMRRDVARIIEGRPAFGDPWQRTIDRVKGGR